MVIQTGVNPAADVFITELWVYHIPTTTTTQHCLAHNSFHEENVI